MLRRLFFLLRGRQETGHCEFCLCHHAGRQSNQNMHPTKTHAKRESYAESPDFSVTLHFGVMLRLMSRVCYTAFDARYLWQQHNDQRKALL